jgi:hypothetical protein
VDFVYFSRKTVVPDAVDLRLYAIGRQPDAETALFIYTTTLKAPNTTRWIYNSMKLKSE